jgi:hypothetical protein
MARLLREVPELMVLIKGIGVASRTVLCFWILWIIIVYVFAVLFRQLTTSYAYSDASDKYFPSVPEGMSTLLLDGIFPLHAQIMNDMGVAHWIMWPVMLLFVVLVSLILLNMLVGVMVDVIQVIGASQKETAQVTLVASQLRTAMSDMGHEADTSFTKYEFQKFVSEPDVMAILGRNDVDLVALLETSEIIFEDLDRQGEQFTFNTLINVAMDMRGSNGATVKDINETQRIVKSLVQESEQIVSRTITNAVEHLSKELKERDAEREAREREKMIEDDDMSDDELSDGATADGSQSVQCMTPMGADSMMTLNVSALTAFSQESSP